MSTSKSASSATAESNSSALRSGKNTRPHKVGENGPVPFVAGADIARHFDDLGAMNPSMMPSTHIMRLQRMMGNQAVANLIARKASAAGGAIGLEGGPVNSEIEQGISRARGGGAPLGKKVQSQMEEGFGTDFSKVRVHTGGEADTLNRSMSARAFTTGSDIFFQKGAYNPGSGDGRKLLAHELTHVVQQGGANKVQRKLKVGPANDRYEEEADQIASSVMRSPSVQRSPAGVIQRDIRTTLSNMGTSISTGVTNAKNSISTRYNNYKNAKQLKKQRKALAPKKVTVGERIRDEMTDKSTQIVGKEDKRSINSRDESAKSLDMSVDERVSGIQEAIATEDKPTNLFKRVAFLLEGKLTEGIDVAYQRITGEDLRAVIRKHFTNRPHKHSGDYLLSILDNQGEAPLKSRLWLTLGLVDSPVVSNERLVKLIERAPYPIFKALWQLPAFKTEITDAVEKKTLERIEAYVDMQNKNTAVELKKATSTTVTKTERDALAAARDKHLASIINFRKRELGKTAKLGLKVLKLATKIPMLAPLAPVPMMVKMIGTSVDTQRLTDDINKWRMSAEQEDIVYLRSKGRTSAFEQALALLPRTKRMSNLRGLEEFEVTYLRQLATADIGTGVTNAQKENKNVSNSVYNSIQRGKGTKRLSKVKKYVRKMVGGGEWDNVMSQLTSLTSEQREELLNRFTGTTRIDKLTQLKLELKQAGFGDDKIGPIVATFENTLDEAGSNYMALLDYIHSQIYMKSKLKKFQRAVSNPTQAKKSKEFGKKVLKIVSEFRGNEYAQLRQNTTLLSTIEANSGKEWFAIMRILGITSANNTLTGTNEQIISESQKKAEESPEYWASLIEKVAVKTEKGAGYDYSPQPLNNPPGTNPPKPKKPAKVEKIRIDEIGWIVMRAQGVAQQVEEDTSNNLDAAGFMMNIYNALQPETRTALDDAGKTTKTDTKAIEKADAYKRVYLALTDQANNPLHSKDAITKSMKKAKTTWYKRGWRPRPDRVRIVNSFSKLEGKELLDEWSNFGEYKGLYEGAQDMDTQIQKLSGDIDKKKTAVENETDTGKKGELNNDLNVLNNRMIKMMGMRREVDTMMKGFVLGIKRDRNQQLLKMTGLVSEDRLKIIAMLNEKIIAAAESDTDVQMAMMMVEMDFDDWMKTKMRGVDALEMQRYIDHSRQWHLFSNKSAQLDEGTRRVVGTVRSGNEELREGQKTNKSEEQLQSIKSRYVQKGEEELSDRKEIEAAFKDMRAKFNARASLIIRIITTALITAVSVGISAASMGIATPVMAAISGGLLLSQIAMHSAFDYFVLKKPVSQIAVEASIAVLQAAFTMLSMNLVSAMNASFLHPDMFLKGSEWLAPNISKALSKTILGIVMAYPKSVLKLAYNQQLLEKAIEAGKEKAMGDTLLKNLAMGAAKPWLRFVFQSSVGGVMYGVEQAKAPIHEGIYGTPPSSTPPTTTPTTPPPSPTRDPGGFVGHQVDQGMDNANNSVKSFLTPKTTAPTPKGDFGTVFTSQDTFNDNLGTMVDRQGKNLKKYAKKNAVGKDGQGGWLHTTSQSNQHRENVMGANRDRVSKGMKLVTGGNATKLTTGVTPLSTDVHVVYFGGGWRLEDTGTPKTATLNGEAVTGAMKLTPGDIVNVGGTKYTVELGS